MGRMRPAPERPRKLSSAGAPTAVIGKMSIMPSQCRSELESLIGQHRIILLDARRRLERETGLARHDVDMQVEHDLPAGGLGELLQGDALGIEDRHGGFRDLLCNLHHMGKDLGIGIDDVACRRLGYDQRVSGRTRHDVEEREGALVLVDLVARQFPAQIFANTLLES